MGTALIPHLDSMLLFPEHLRISCLQSIGVTPKRKPISQSSVIELYLIASKGPIIFIFTGRFGE